MKIPWSRPSIGAAEKAAVDRVFQSGWFTQGPEVEQFERELAEYVGVEHAVAMNNGTSTLLAAFASVFKPGDVVAVPTYTFVSTLNSLMLAGCIPRLVDMDPRTGNMDLASLEEMASELDGVCIVDIAGQPHDTFRLRDIILEHDLRLVEDAAEAIGAESSWGRVGAHGHPTVFSFHAAKLVTTFEGGAVTTDSRSLAQHLRRFRNHGQGRKFDAVHFGLNLRMTDLQAAIGRAQLHRLSDFIERRNKLVALYKEKLSGTFDFPVVEDYVRVHPYMLFFVLAKNWQQAVRAEDVLDRAGIEFRSSWPPLHKQVALRGYFEGEKHPAAESWYDRAFALPLYNDMTETEVMTVVDALLHGC